MSEVIRGLTPDGLLPTEAQAQVAGMIGAEVDPLAALTITGAGRPDQPATLTTPGTDTLVAAAANGTVFRSLDGAGVGAWEWQKQGATWKVTNGDTGWLHAGGLMKNGWQASNGSVRLSRTDDWVNFVSLYTGTTSMRPEEADSDTFVTLPAGFRISPASNYGLVGVAGVAPWAQSGSTFYQVLRDLDHQLAVSRKLPTVSFNLKWRTADPWPATLTL